VPENIRFQPERRERCTLTKPVLVVILSAALILGVMGGWLWTQAPASECPTQPSFTPRDRILNPSKVVIEPWRGQHHVYGLILLSKQFESEQITNSSLTIEGVPVAFSSEPAESTDYDHVMPKAGDSLMRMYVQTRTALWFLATGRFGGIRTPCQWVLTVVEREN